MEVGAGKDFASNGGRSNLGHNFLNFFFLFEGKFIVNIYNFLKFKNKIETF